MSKTNTYYECHITLNCKDDFEVGICQSVTESKGWSHSRIAGDVVEGAGVKCYATRHYTSRFTVDTIIRAVEIMAENYPDRIITRKKVELVVYDTKSSKIRPHDIA